MHKQTDILIIGGGVVGCAAARELSRFSGAVTLVEAQNDISCGTSKANSGIVHAGHDAEPGTNKAKYNRLGAGLFEAAAKELDFPFRRTGALVVCFSEDEYGALAQLKARGEENGVTGMALLTVLEARRIEPFLNENAFAALYVPSSGIAGPYEMTAAYAENAAQNGVQFAFHSPVTAIARRGGGFTVTAGGDTYACRAIVNCAGVFSGEIHRMATGETVKMTARKGEYVLTDKYAGGLCSHTLFRLPGKMGKGILVSPTVSGNLIAGPNAYDIEGLTDVDTTYPGLEEVFSGASLLLPALSRRDIITQFAGLRAHLERGDFVIGRAAEGFYNAMGIESPGLTAAPAIAKALSLEVAADLRLTENPAFEPKRQGIRRFAYMTGRECAEAIARDPRYGNVVCRCETVTEAEIVEAITRTPGATDLDGVKRRTRAGMGRCQSGFCMTRVMEILARERGVDIRSIGKCGIGSEIVTGKIRGEE